MLKIHVSYISRLMGKHCIEYNHTKLYNVIFITYCIHSQPW